MPYNYAAAKAALSDAEKDRILALYLCSDTTAINALFDWEKATQAYGSASVDSMKVSLRNSIKKIEKQGDVEGGEPSPAKTPGGRKRKTKGEGDAAEGTPKKRGGRKKKDAKAEVTDQNNEEPAERIKNDDYD